MTRDRGRPAKNEGMLMPCAACIEHSYVVQRGIAQRLSAKHPEWSRERCEARARIELAKGNS